MSARPHAAAPARRGPQVPLHRYVSADNHLNTQWLPADLWQQRLPARLRERGPRVVETPEGSYWSWEGKRRKRAADGSSNAALLSRTFAAVDPPAGALPPSEPATVRAHLDLAGVWGAVLFGDTRKWEVEDDELLLAMVRAYNDFCLELSATEPRRLVYLPELPARDPRGAVAELARVADLGAGAVELSPFDLGAELSDPVWEPLWTEAEERAVVLCSHTGHGAGTPLPPRERGAKLAHHATSPFVAARPIAEMVFGGVFERHPRLTWVMAECRIGWLPFLFSWMDRQVRIREHHPSVALELPPSEYVRRNVRFTFEDDEVGARLLAGGDTLLADTVMWACDYPHPQEVWPDPEPALERMFAGLDPALRHEIVCGRALELFRFEPLPAAAARP